MITSLNITSDLLYSSHDDHSTNESGIELSAVIRQLNERVSLMKSLAVDLCDMKQTAVWIQSITATHIEWINRFTNIYQEWSERGSRLGIDDLNAGLSLSQMSWLNDYHRWKAAYYPTLIDYCNSWKSEYEDGRTECATLLSQCMRWITAAQKAVDDYHVHQKRTNIVIPRINDFFIPQSVSTTSIHNNQPTPLPITIPLTPFVQPPFAQSMHDNTLHRFLLQTDANNSAPHDQQTPSLVNSSNDLMDATLSSMISADGLSNTISSSYSITEGTEEFEQEIANVVSSSSAYALSSIAASHSSLASMHPFNETLLMSADHPAMITSAGAVYESLSMDILSFTSPIDDPNHDEWEDGEEYDQWNNHDRRFSSHTIMGI